MAIMFLTLTALSHQSTLFIQLKHFLIDFFEYFFRQPALILPIDCYKQNGQIKIT